MTAISGYLLLYYAALFAVALTANSAGALTAPAGLHSCLALCFTPPSPSSRE